MSINDVEFEEDRSAAFAPTKIFVTINVRGSRGPAIRLLHAQEGFFSAFRYCPRDLPIFLSSLISEENNRSGVSSLEHALTTGAGVTLNLNLRDKFNEPLSCQMSVAAGFSVNPADSGANRPAGGQLITVITIRSACVTEHSTAIGLMVREPRKASTDEDCPAEKRVSSVPLANPDLGELQEKKQRFCSVPCEADDEIV